MTDALSGVRHAPHAPAHRNADIVVPVVWRVPVTVGGARGGVSMMNICSVFGLMAESRVLSYSLRHGLCSGFSVRPVFRPCRRRQCRWLGGEVSGADDGRTGAASGTPVFGEDGLPGQTAVAGGAGVSGGIGQLGSGQCAAVVAELLDFGLVQPEAGGISAACASQVQLCHRLAVLLKLRGRAGAVFVGRTLYSPSRIVPYPSLRNPNCLVSFSNISNGASTDTFTLESSAVTLMLS